MAALLATALGVLIVKPWGVPDSPTPTATPVGSAGSLPAASPPTTRPGASSAAVPSATGRSAFDGGFTTPVPPDATTSWTALRWHRVEHDPLSLVTSVLRWRLGFVALGLGGAGDRLTPVWTSTDGAHWALLASNTSGAFWPGVLVRGVAEVQGGTLVALTETAYGCGGAACSPTYVPSMVAWTSPDGRAWTPHALLPTDWLSSPSGSPPLFAVGPAGVVAASAGPAARIATSTDGVEWQHLPTSTLPPGFALTDLRGTATGYVAAGRWMTSDTRSGAASMWSADGRDWSSGPILLPTSSKAESDGESAVASLVAGRDGMIAVGHGDTTPGATLWWQSSDGRRWRPLPTFAPLGPSPCSGDGCEHRPDGVLAGDGERLLAVRGGPDAGAWESSDGHAWRRLDMTGDLPGGDAREATLMPGGVLVTDGSSTWFGEALVP
jgi:hypothetical protein